MRFKRCFFNILALIMAISCMPFCNTKASAAYAPGDVDKINGVTVDDARIVLRAAVGLEKIDDSDSYFAADVTGTDGLISVEDARVILRAAVGLQRFGTNSITTKDEIIDFYKIAVNRVAAGGVAGYHYKVSSKVLELDTTIPLLNLTLRNQLEKAGEPKESTFIRGSEDGKSNFPACTLTDYNNIASASVQDSDGNYCITLILRDETNPTNDNNRIGQIMNSAMTFEEFKESLKGTGFYDAVTLENTHIFYDDPKIVCTVSKTGRIISMNHIKDIKLTLDTSKPITLHTLETREYTSFIY